ncbi:polysaccharide deacetylase family protein [Streptomyces sp. H10-C2]|uniref:polysaccharide deacetylase family protein n=1 Tax=unclassified Streptomyces TaxID=2593676 RepID=UPI0024B8F60B|nr:MULTISPECIES: polysaccharide deacetylase family protein [unclassified Streptomyces]MDJ0340608.1 polysaccharide deacetylase family protein [Streptomyces sp. PH10-H1]MDJ0370256.1 polysaccharide deacetylase family protein [Streptomyces sp. H10-C2]
MRRKAAGLILSGLLLATGCSAGSSSPNAAPTASGTGPSAAPSSDGSTAPGGPDDTSGTADAFRKWKIKPMAQAPAAPKTKPVRTGSGAPPVVSDIPTREKIVFVTFDDGAEKDPKFVTMMRELKVPFTMFLTDDIIRSDYGYFKPLQELGNAIQNHTLSHPNLRTESESAQRHEICTQQTKLKAEYGTTPHLFRPPYGNWNEDTRTAVKACGPQAIILWRESMQIKGMQYQRGDKKLHPGDIILAHFRGPSELKGTSMTEMTANMLRMISDQGFTVARLEDYV